MTQTANTQMTDTQMINEAPLCRSCGQGNLTPVLSLGQSPLANALVSADQLDAPEAFYPLELVFCPGCSLVQITESIPPATLFREYLYFSSFSDTMLRHAEALVGHLSETRRLNENSLVVEVASNDGYLLQYYQGRGIPVLGIEPAVNIAKVAREEKGIRTISEFFGADLAAQLGREGERADVIHAHNVLAHVDDLNGFVRGLETLLKDNGVAVIEAPYVKDMIDHCEFDTIYHEHLCYFSLSALDRLFERHGLIIQDAERVAIHGGSLRIVAGRAAFSQRNERVRALLDEEQAWGVDDIEFYRHFAQRVENLKVSLLKMLHDLKRQGKKLAAYGASAKGSTLVNYFGIGPDLLDFVVDRSTYKQGYFMPGTHLPIAGPTRLLSDKPDYVVLLVWNFAEEVLRQQAEYRQNGGKFIVPIPEPVVV